MFSGNEWKLPVPVIFTVHLQLLFSEDTSLVTQSNWILILIKPCKKSECCSLLPIQWHDRFIQLKFSFASGSCFCWNQNKLHLPWTATVWVKIPLLSGNQRSGIVHLFPHTTCLCTFDDCSSSVNHQEMLSVRPRLLWKNTVALTEKYSPKPDLEYGQSWCLKPCPPECLPLVVQQFPFPPENAVMLLVLYKFRYDKWCITAGREQTTWP